MLLILVLLCSLCYSVTLLLFSSPCSYIRNQQLTNRQPPQRRPSRGVLMRTAPDGQPAPGSKSSDASSVFVKWRPALPRLPGPGELPEAAQEADATLKRGHDFPGFGRKPHFYKCNFGGSVCAFASGFACGAGQCRAGPLPRTMPRIAETTSMDGFLPPESCAELRQFLHGGGIVFFLSSIKRRNLRGKLLPGRVMLDAHPAQCVRPPRYWGARCTAA